MKSLDLFLPCIPRSASTAIACAIHQPPEQVFLIEPRITDIDKALRRIEVPYKRVGAKEVAPKNIIGTLDACEPENIICIVRDLKDVAASLFEMCVVKKHPTGMTIVEATELSLGTAACLLGLSSWKPFVRYEELTQDFEPLRSLLSGIGWKLGLVDYNHHIWKGREWEIRDAAAGFLCRKRIPTSEAKEYVKSMLCSQTAVRYQERFGYDLRTN